MTHLPRRAALTVFAVFAFAYFFSTLVRGVTATLAPTLTQELALRASDLGLLAGGYFLGFAMTQLPLGRWLDRHGPKKVILAFLSVAVLGCLAFSAATGFAGLLAARVLCGVGVSACLMAPLTGYRRWFDANIQLRLSSWMLMTGSLGLLAATLPVQWLLPLAGWRPLFWGLAGLIALAMALIACTVPRWEPNPRGTVMAGGYAAVWRHPYFRRMASLSFICYGGMVAIQTLWAGPWMIQVASHSPAQAATGLFVINLTMLGSFWFWGMVTPGLLRRGHTAERLIARGLPLSFAAMALLIAVGADLADWTPAVLALYGASCSVVSLAQPAVGMAFPPALAGRALSAYNLVIFVGVFVVQWGIGLMVDGFRALGMAEVDAFRAAMAAFLSCCLFAYAHFMRTTAHNHQP